MSYLLQREQIVAGVGRLPALPSIVHQLEAAVRDDNLRAEEIVRLVANDQATTAAALRLANSPFYGVGGRVVTLRDAVQILGIRTLSSAVTTAAVMASFDRTACPAFDFDSAWRHALATALCAQSIAAERGVDAGTAYTCGLLHDIGRLALATAFPVPYSSALEFAARTSVPPDVAERELLGADHAEVGALIAAHWRLAPAVVASIRDHHDVPEAGHDMLLDVLHLADNITHALDLSAELDDMVPPLSLGAWERVNLGGDELQALFLRIETRMQQADLQAA